MSKISNNVFEKSKVTHSCIYWEDVFSNEEIDLIVQECERTELMNGTVGEDALNESIRKSNVNFHNRHENNDWIFDRFNSAIEDINDKFYGFDLYGYDFYQYSQYKGEENGRYDFHIDMSLGNDRARENATRKLSLTFLLNEPGVDFEGGDFQIATGLEKDAQNINVRKGTLIAFPSFIHHRVTPVTRGTRKSIVIWVEGPKFR